MKFTVEVDLNEFFTEEDGASFSEEIKHYICQQVKNNIYKDWGVRIDEQIRDNVKAIVSEEKERVINETIMTILATNKIRKSHYGPEMITVEEYIQEEFKNMYNMDSRFERSLKDILDKKSKTLIDQLQERYDVAFATQIVIKLNENKMLKDDIASLLLPSVNSEQ